MTAADIPTVPGVHAIRAARSVLSAAADQGGVSPVRFAAAPLWFKTSDPAPDPETWARDIPRGTQLQYLLFDLFACDAAVYSGRRLDWRQLLLATCTHAAPLEGLRLASEVVGAVPGMLTVAEARVLLTHSRPRCAARLHITCTRAMPTHVQRCRTCVLFVLPPLCLYSYLCCSFSRLAVC